MGLLARMLPTWLKRSTEGQYRPGPYALEEGVLSAKAGRFWNFWQMGYKPMPYGEPSAMVEACVSAYAQTVAMCPGTHWRRTANGGREPVENSALARFLAKPNDYQSISDFLMNMTRRTFEKGEAFALVVRNGRNEIQEMHLMRYGYPLVGSDGSIFYHLAGNEIAEARVDFGYPFPARDVLHLRLYTPTHPLKGVPPLLATTLELALAGAAMNQQVAFYLNQARPSFMLETDQQLTQQQTEDLRARWDSHTKGENAGGTPILAWGLKAKPVTMSPHDAKLADMLKITNEAIALAFRLPLQVLGLGQTAFSSTEALMSAWRASGLGFVLNHIEEAFGLMFGLQGQPHEYLELDTEALMRSAFKDRIEGLSRAVISGIFSPDEVRNREGYDSVPGGHGAEPRVQQQVVPLSYWATIAEKQANPQPAQEAPNVDPTKWAPADADRAVREFRAAFARGRTDVAA